MFKNYFKTTFRSLSKNRLFTLVNILGLSIGLTAAILIFQYTFFQLSFDDFHDKSEQIYRVINERFEGDQMIQKGQITYSAVGLQLAEDFPEILEHTTVNYFGKQTLIYNEELYQVPVVPLVENSFFEVFSFELLLGDKSTVFLTAEEVAISESWAHTMFGTTSTSELRDFMGTTLFLGSTRTPLKLTAIFKDTPNNSSLNFDMLLSREFVISRWGEHARFSWTGSDYFHYVVLAPNTDVDAFSEKLDQFSAKYFRGDEVTGTNEKFLLQALNDVHLNPEYEYEFHDTADGRMVWILGMTAVFILAMAWVNYVNLTTSKSLQRAKEVGLRKVIGASRAQLIAQFMIESLILNVIAFLFSLTLVQILQRSYANLLDQELSLSVFMMYEFAAIPVIIWVLILVLVGAVLSGIYPAFVLSKYKPSDTLKGNFSRNKESSLLRKGLVIFQFILSTILIGGTYLVIKQTNFMRQQDLGANVEQVMTVKGPSITAFDTTFVTRIASFMSALEQNSNVIKAGTSSNDFGERLPRTFNVAQKGQEDGHMLNRMGINYGFLDVYEIKLLAGRAFRSNDHKSDWNQISACVLNYEAARLYGFEDPEEAISKQLSFFGKDWTIVGVSADFHQRSLKESIEPLIMLPLYEWGDDTYHIRINSQNIDETIEYVASVYNQFYPGDLFEYGFTDQEFENMYKSDRQFGQVFNIFSVIAILIACLGLFGLVGYTAVQKTKEIGIRKVLGASVSDILTLISREFLALILLASCIALPFTYWAGTQWLDGFAYQTSISLSFFIIPLISVLAIAILVILIQTMKTAQENPIKSLHQD